MLSVIGRMPQNFTKPLNPSTKFFEFSYKIVTSTYYHAFLCFVTSVLWGLYGLRQTMMWGLHGLGQKRQWGLYVSELGLNGQWYLYREDKLSRTDVT